MSDLSPEAEQALAAMSESEFAALTARLRAPDTREAYREIAKQFAPNEEALDAWMDTVDVSKFVDDKGVLDEARVRSKLGVLFGGRQFGGGLNQHEGCGQHGSPGTPGGVGNRQETPDSYRQRHAPDHSNAGLKEAERRYGKRNPGGGAPAKPAEQDPPTAHYVTNSQQGR